MTNLARPCSPMELRPGRGATLTEPGLPLAGQSQGSASGRAVLWLRLFVDVRDALEHGDPGRNGQYHDDDAEHPAVESEAEDPLRRGEQNDPLRTLEHPHLGVDTECLGASACVRREKRTDDSREAYHDHRCAVVLSVERVVDGETAEDRAVGQPVQG